MTLRRRIARQTAWAALGLALAAGPAAAQQDAGGPAATLPDWSGVWFTTVGSYVEISGFTTGETPPPPSDGAPPGLLDAGGPWTEQARAILLERVANGGAGKAEGWGYPMMMVGLTPLQFVVTPRETVIVTAYRDMRLVMTDGRPLSDPDDRWTTAWGESVGRWEGDTLVIETVAVRQPNLFLIAPPFSENARYTERLRKTGPDRIEGELTIIDPEALVSTWTVPLVYVRAEGLDRLVYDTFTNDRSELDGEVWSIAPSEGDAAAP